MLRLWPPHFVSLVICAAAALVQQPLPPGTVVKRYVGYDFNEACGESKLVAVRQPLCRNATIQPWFPGVVVSTNPLKGELTVVFGLDASPGGRWANDTELEASNVLAVPCLDQWPKGPTGRGYGYLPPCTSSDCIQGCRAIPAETCLQGEVIAFGENCTVQCPAGMITHVVNVTCRADASLKERTVPCEVPIVYCDQLEEFTSAVTPSGNASGASSEPFNATALASKLRCVIRAVRTTTTTLQMVSGDLVLRGCTELTPLSSGILTADPSILALPVGLPAAVLESGAFYYEVILEGPWERVGFVDAEWTGDSEYDARHEFLSDGGGPGIVGAAVNIVAKGLAQIWFHRGGRWQGSGVIPTIQEARFTPPLRPVGLFHGRHTWVLPYDAWRYSPPAVRYRPLTRFPFPDACRFPLDYAIFASPPVCGTDFEELTRPEDCSKGAFDAGLSDWTATEVALPGWPSGCFDCPNCDLDGALYLNRAPPADTVAGAGLFQYTANDTAVVCRRRDPERTVTATTTTWTGAQRPTASPPLYRRFAEGTCGSGYTPVLNVEACRRAAVSLTLADLVPDIVTLRDGLVAWPPGCFYCRSCEIGSLLFNNVIFNASAQAAAGPSGPAEPICRAIADVLTTGPPTTTAAATSGPTSTTTTLKPFFTTTFTTSTYIEPVDRLGKLQCEGAYVIVVVPPWWQRMEFYIGVAAIFVLCCCCPCCCFCSGFPGHVAQRVEIWVETHPRAKRSCCCRCLFACGRCWARSPCGRALRALSVHMRSPRSPRSPRMRKGASKSLEEGTARPALERIGSSEGSGLDGSEGPADKPRFRRKGVREGQDDMRDVPSKGTDASSASLFDTPRSSSGKPKLEIAASSSKRSLSSSSSSKSSRSSSSSSSDTASRVGRAAGRKPATTSTKFRSSSASSSS